MTPDMSFARVVVHEFCTAQCDMMGKKSQSALNEPVVELVKAYLRTCSTSGRVQSEAFSAARTDVTVTILYRYEEL